MPFAQGHNAVLQVRLEPATPLSQGKYSSTEHLRSLFFIFLNGLIDDTVDDI